ncbi:hypothetical protein BC361_26000 [Ensifer sp. LC54]|nr:hypothetical protein BC361_26000 [Ensifer sp. LC54]OCP23198.1 hypothetical protein BC363_24765 [Ensifer sp. LC384]
MAEFRRVKRAEGFLESTVWLSPEERLMVEKKVGETGMSKSDVVRQALRLAFGDEPRMSA